jgi:hypothetical protein
MSVTREKTICKEKMITNQGKYNYLRLTNNNFAQLLGILAEMKMKMIEEDDSKTFRIHEETELLEATNKFNKKYTNFEDFCKDFNNPHEVMAYLKIRKMDWPDYNITNNKPFAWPDKLLSTEIANCWDYALFFYYFCKKKHIPVDLYRIALYGDYIGDANTENEIWCMGHMIAVCKCSDGWYTCNYMPPTIQALHKMGSMYGPFKTEEEAMKTYALVYETLDKFMLQKQHGYKAFYKIYGPYYKKMNNNGYRLMDKYYNNYSINQEDIKNKDMGVELPFDNKVSKHSNFEYILAKGRQFASNILHKLGSIFESAEEYDKAKYQEQDDIERKCMNIYQTIDVKFADLVEVVNGESYLEDGFTDSEVYMACYIHPKMINADYEPTFKRIITKINNHLKKTYPKENIVGFWIDEVEPLRGYGIGIEEASINESLLYEEPLRYQSTSYDCANAAILNAASYISDFTEIPTVFFKKVNEVCLDKCNDIEMKGTSRDAVKHIANWLNEYSNNTDFFIRCKIYEGADVTFLNSPYLLNDIKQPNTAVVLLCNLYDEHWVTITDADNNYLYLFDPYYWNEGYNDTKIKYVNDPFKANRKIPIDFMETTNGVYYSLKPIENKLAVVFENVSKV